MSEADRDFTEFVRLMIIDLGDLNDDYPIYYIEMAYETPQLMRQPTREASDIYHAVHNYPSSVHSVV